MARRFVRPNSGWNSQPTQPVVEKAKPVAMVLDFPGSVEIESADVCLFADSDEAHVDIHATMGGALITATVGRLDPRSGGARLAADSVKTWAEQHGLVYSHEDEPATTRAGEAYVVVHLVRKGRTSVWNG